MRNLCVARPGMGWEDEAEQLGTVTEALSLLTVFLSEKKKTLQQSKKPSASVLREARLIGAGQLTQERGA